MEVREGELWWVQKSFTKPLDDSSKVRHKRRPQTYMKVSFLEVYFQEKNLCSKRFCCQMILWNIACSGIGNSQFLLRYWGHRNPSKSSHLPCAIWTDQSYLLALRLFRHWNRPLCVSLKSMRLKLSSLNICLQAFFMWLNLSRQGVLPLWLCDGKCGMECTTRQHLSREWQVKAWGWQNAVWFVWM